MGKKISKMRPRELAAIEQALARTSRTFVGENSVQDFIEQTLTEGERIQIGRRLLIAQYLMEGLPQSEIRARLNVSPNTFGKIYTWIEGQLPGYADVLRAYQKRCSGVRGRKRKVSTYAPPFSLARMKKQYPAHFLILNLYDVLRNKDKKD